MSRKVGMKIKFTLLEDENDIINNVNYQLRNIFYLLLVLHSEIIFLIYKKFIFKKIKNSMYSVKAKTE